MKPTDLIFVRQKSCGTKVQIQRRWFHPAHYEMLNRIVEQTEEEVAADVELMEKEVELREDKFAPQPYCGPCGKDFARLQDKKAHDTRYHA